MENDEDFHIQQMDIDYNYMLPEEILLKQVKCTSYSSKELDKICRKSIFHKYFLASIFTVKEDYSRHVLFEKLKQQLDAGIYHVPMSDIDSLFYCLFYAMPKYKPIQSNPEHMDFIFKLMNIFMSRFYTYAFPFFYQSKTDDSLFTHDIPFVINYINMFNYNFMFRQLPDTNKYIDELLEDGSFIRMFDYLFDLYQKGINFDEVSKCIYQLMQWVPFEFLKDYLTKKNFFDKCFAIFTNHQTNLMFRMNFPIAFFINYFTKNYTIIIDEKTQETLQYRIIFMGQELSHQELKKEVAERLIEDINNFKIIHYLESFLSNYIDQLIIEKRLLNTKNPFHPDQDPSLSFPLKIYPEYTNDDDIMRIFNLFVLIFRTIYDANYPTCVMSFYPIISAFFMIVPDIHTHDFYCWTTGLFTFLQITSLPDFEMLVNVFLESIRNRLYGYFNYSEYIKKTSYFISRKEEKQSIDDLFNDLNILSASSLILCLFPPKENPLIDPFKFLESIKLESLDSIKKIINILLNFTKSPTNRNSTKKLCLSTFLYYRSIATRNDLIECYLKLYFAIESELQDEDYQQIIDSYILNDLIKCFITTPNITQIINPKTIFEFCNKTGKYAAKNEAFINDILGIAFSSEDLFKMKIVSIILKNGNNTNYNEFTKTITQNIIRKAIDSIPESSAIDAQYVQRVISVSPYLISFKFTDDKNVFDLIRSCINYLNSFDIDLSQTEFLLLNQDNILLNDLLDQAKVNLVYSLANSFGFNSYNDCIWLISFLLEKYGMCIETLNIISDIISYLTPFICTQDMPNEIKETNDFIFKILQILIENHPKELMKSDEVEEQDESEARDPYHSKSRGTIIHHFALFPVGYDRNDNYSRNRNYGPNKYNKARVKVIDDDEMLPDMMLSPDMMSPPDMMPQMATPLSISNENNNCFYSYKANGVKIDDHFGHEISVEMNEPLRKSKFMNKSIITVNFFTRNIAEYILALLSKYGIQKDSIIFYKQIIFNAYINGLLRYSSLEQLFRFIAENQEFFIDEEEINEWMRVSIIRITALLAFSGKEQRDNSLQFYDLGQKNDHLLLYIRFLRKLNSNYPGIINDRIFALIAQQINRPEEMIADFFLCDESDFEDKLRLFISKKKMNVKV